MTDIDLTAVPLAALTVEIKRRMNELEAARADWGWIQTPYRARQAKVLVKALHLKPLLNVGLAGMHTKYNTQTPHARSSLKLKRQVRRDR